VATMPEIAASVPARDASRRQRSATALQALAYNLRRDSGALTGACILAFFAICTILAPWLAPYGPTEADPALRLQGIGTAGHWLGLDSQGRDMLSRLLYGARISMLTGIVPVAVGMIISIPLGLLSAHCERAGNLIMRSMDILFAFPMVLLAIMFAAFLGPGLTNLMIALVLVLIPYNTRVAYVEALAQKGAGYIEAARAAGTSDANILFTEMLPHVMSASLVYSMTVVGTIIITAAGLSFLGLGVQPPTAEWGIMTSEGRTVLHIAPHVATLPGIAIFLLVTGFNLIGDSVRDALDPRTRSIARKPQDGRR
jgi:peptide/nickel transport system permease protein